MIFGVGTDIVAVKRIDDLHVRYGGKLAERILAPEEWGDYAEAVSKDHFLAKRFAAKEAFAKAAGTGVRPPLTLTALRVTHDALGKPGFAYGPELAAWVRLRGIHHAHLSITDERDHALAFVVLEAA